MRNKKLNRHLYNLSIAEGFLKNHGLKNPFSEQTRWLFLQEKGYIYCWECGRSDLGAEPHHILGRVSSSPFNAAPLCSLCHGNVSIDKQGKIRKYLKKTKDYLFKIQYFVTKKDKEFLEKYARNYN